MKIIKHYAAQRCIGYTGNKTWYESRVEFTDGSQGTVYRSQTRTDIGVMIEMGYETERPYIETPVLVPLHWNIPVAPQPAEDQTS